jgi:hypothetical protein
MKKAIHAIREIWRVRCVIYLDDLLILHQDPNRLKEIAPQITQFLQYLGWTVNLEKSNLIPSNQFKYLGWMWNTLDMSVHLPEEIKYKKCTSVRILAKLIGKLSATRTQFIQASLYLKQLSDYLNIRVNKEGWDTYVLWEYRMISEIKWWLKTIKTNKPHFILFNPTFQAVITTDASPIVWGATFQAVNQNVRINLRKEMEKLSQEEKNLAILSEKGRLYSPTSLTNTKWSFTDQLGLKLNQKLQKYCQIAQKKKLNFMKKQTSNLKEITAIYLALHHFLPLIKKSRYKNILIRTDNTAAIYYIVLFPLYYWGNPKMY